MLARSWNAQNALRSVAASAHLRKRVAEVTGRASSSLPDPSRLEAFIKEEPTMASARIMSALSTANPAGSISTFVAEYEASQSEPAPLTAKQTALVLTAAALPAVGFGFTDNVIMILAGEEIDSSLGVMFGLSTMAAAGFGNMISDVMGVQLEGFIERTAGVKDPPLTAAQRRSGRYRKARGFGKTAGIAVGCLLGMLPLLIVLPKWLKARVQNAKAAIGLETPAHSVHTIVADKTRQYMEAVAEQAQLLGSHSATLWVVDPETRNLFTLPTAAQAAAPVATSSDTAAPQPVRPRRLVVPRSDAAHPLQLVTRTHAARYTTQVVADADTWRVKFADSLPANSPPPCPKSAPLPALPESSSAAPRSAVQRAVAFLDVFHAAAGDEQYGMDQYTGVETAYFLPLFDEQRAPIGVLQVLRRTGRRFSPEELHLASSVGTHAAAAVRALLAFRDNAISDSSVGTGEGVKEEAAAAEYDLPGAFGILAANCGVRKET